MIINYSLQTHQFELPIGLAHDSNIIFRSFHYLKVPSE